MSCDFFKEWSANRLEAVSALLTVFVVAMVFGCLVSNISGTFFVIAIAFTLFHGFFAFEAHKADQPTSWQQYVHQIWFNLIGSAAGWSSAYFLIFVKFKCVQTLSCNLRETGYSTGVFDIFLTLVMLYGVTGNLSWALMVGGLLDKMKK